MIDFEEKPVTEPKWSLVKIPWRDKELHAFDQLTTQLVFDYAHLHGFDQRRSMLQAIPQTLWERIPKESDLMLILQQGTGNDMPAHTDEQVLEAFKAETWISTPETGSEAYELYKFIFEKHQGELSKLSLRIIEIEKILVRLGASPAAIPWGPKP